MFHASWFTMDERCITTSPIPSNTGIQKILLDFAGQRSSFHSVPRPDDDLLSESGYDPCISLSRLFFCVEKWRGGKLVPGCSVRRFHSTKREPLNMGREENVFAANRNGYKFNNRLSASWFRLLQCLCGRLIHELLRSILSHRGFS